MKFDKYYTEYTLAESMNTKMDIQYESLGRGKLRATAVIDGRTFILDAVEKWIPAYHDDADDDIYTYVEFGDIGSDGKVNIKQTNAGNELQVFSFVVQAFAEVVKRLDPKEIRFGAINDNGRGSREALYKRLSARLASKHGYTVFHQKHRTEDSTLFYMRKKK